MPLLITPLGCKNQRLMLQGVDAVQTLGSKANLGWHSWRKKEARYVAAQSNQQSNPPPPPPESLPQVMKASSTDHSQIKAIAWSPPTPHSHFWSVWTAGKLITETPRVKNLQLITKSWETSLARENTDWSKTQFSCSARVCLCSVLRVWSHWKTLRNYCKDTQKPNCQTNLSYFKRQFCCPSKEVLGFKKHKWLGFPSIWSELTATTSWKESECCPTWLSARHINSDGHLCQIYPEVVQWCKRYLWPKKGRITGKFCAHNAKICQISFRIVVKSNDLLISSMHFYDIQRDFASFVSRSPWIAIVQIVTKSHVPKILLQGFFVKSGTNQLKFEQINFQEWLDSKNLIRWICIDFGGRANI